MAQQDSSDFAKSIDDAKAKISQATDMLGDVQNQLDLQSKNLTSNNGTTTLNRGQTEDPPSGSSKEVDPEDTYSYSGKQISSIFTPQEENQSQGTNLPAIDELNKDQQLDVSNKEIDKSLEQEDASTINLGQEGTQGSLVSSKSLGGEKGDNLAESSSGSLKGKDQKSKNFISSFFRRSTKDPSNSTEKGKESPSDNVATSSKELENQQPEGKEGKGSNVGSIVGSGLAAAGLGGAAGAGISQLNKDKPQQEEDYRQKNSQEKGIDQADAKQEVSGEQPDSVQDSQPFRSNADMVRKGLQGNVASDNFVSKNVEEPDTSGQGDIGDKSGQGVVNYKLQQLDNDLRSSFQGDNENKANVDGITSPDKRVKFDQQVEDNLDKSKEDPAKTSSYWISQDQLDSKSARTSIDTNKETMDYIPQVPEDESSKTPGDQIQSKDKSLTSDDKDTQGLIDHSLEAKDESMDKKKDNSNTSTYLGAVGGGVAALGAGAASYLGYNAYNKDKKEDYQQDTTGQTKDGLESTEQQAEGNGPGTANRDLEQQVPQSSSKESNYIEKDKDIPQYPTSGNQDLKNKFTPTSDNTGAEQDAGTTTDNEVNQQMPSSQTQNTKDLPSNETHIGQKDQSKDNDISEVQSPTDQDTSSQAEGDKSKKAKNKVGTLFSSLIKRNKSKGPDQEGDKSQLDTQESQQALGDEKALPSASIEGSQQKDLTSPKTNDQISPSTDVQQSAKGYTPEEKEISPKEVEGNVNKDVESKLDTDQDFKNDTQEQNKDSSNNTTILGAVGGGVAKLGAGAASYLGYNAYNQDKKESQSQDKAKGLQEEESPEIADKNIQPQGEHTGYEGKDQDIPSDITSSKQDQQSKLESAPIQGHNVSVQAAGTTIDKDVSMKDTPVSQNDQVKDIDTSEVSSPTDKDKAQQDEGDKLKKGKNKVGNLFSTLLKRKKSKGADQEGDKNQLATQESQQAIVDEKDTSTASAEDSQQKGLTPSQANDQISPSTDNQQSAKNFTPEAQDISPKEQEAQKDKNVESKNDTDKQEENENKSNNTYLGAIGGGVAALGAGAASYLGYNAYNQNKEDKGQEEPQDSSNLQQIQEGGGETDAKTRELGTQNKQDPYTSAQDLKADQIDKPDLLDKEKDASASQEGPAISGKATDVPKHPQQAQSELRDSKSKGQDTLGEESLNKDQLSYKPKIDEVQKLEDTPNSQKDYAQDNTEQDTDKDQKGKLAGGLAAGVIELESASEFVKIQVGLAAGGLGTGIAASQSKKEAREIEEDPAEKAENLSQANKKDKEAKQDESEYKETDEGDKQKKSKKIFGNLFKKKDKKGKDKQGDDKLASQESVSEGFTDEKIKEEKIKDEDIIPGQKQVEEESKPDAGKEKEKDNKGKVAGGLAAGGLAAGGIGAGAGYLASKSNKDTGQSENLGDQPQFQDSAKDISGQDDQADELTSKGEKDIPSIDKTDKDLGTGQISDEKYADSGKSQIHDSIQDKGKEVKDSTATGNLPSKDKYTNNQTHLPSQDTQASDQIKEGGEQEGQEGKGKLAGGLAAGGLAAGGVGAAGAGLLSNRENKDATDSQDVKDQVNQVDPSSQNQLGQGKIPESLAEDQKIEDLPDQSKASGTSGAGYQEEQNVEGVTGQAAGEQQAKELTSETPSKDIYDIDEKAGDTKQPLTELKQNEAVPIDTTQDQGVISNVQDEGLSQQQKAQQGKVEEPGSQQAEDKLGQAPQTEEDKGISGTTKGIIGGGVAATGVAGGGIAAAAFGKDKNKEADQQQAPQQFSASQQSSGKTPNITPSTSQDSTQPTGKMNYRSLIKKNQEAKGKDFETRQYSGQSKDTPVTTTPSTSQDYSQDSKAQPQNLTSSKSNVENQNLHYRTLYSTTSDVPKDNKQSSQDNEGKPQHFNLRQLLKRNKEANSMKKQEDKSEILAGPDSTKQDTLEDTQQDEDDNQQDKDGRKAVLGGVGAAGAVGGAGALGAAALGGQDKEGDGEGAVDKSQLLPQENQQQSYQLEDESPQVGQFNNDEVSFMQNLDEDKQTTQQATTGQTPEQIAEEAKEDPTSTVKDEAGKKGLDSQKEVKKIQEKEEVPSKINQGKENINPNMADDATAKEARAQGDQDTQAPNEQTSEVGEAVKNPYDTTENETQVQDQETETSKKALEQSDKEKKKSKTKGFVNFCRACWK